MPHDLVNSKSSLGIFLPLGRSSTRVEVLESLLCTLSRCSALLYHLRTRLNLSKEAVRLLLPLSIDKRDPTYLIHAAMPFQTRHPHLTSSYSLRELK
jgi:hypothetical protein